MRLPIRSLLLLSCLFAALPASAAEQAGVSAAVRGQVALTRAQIVGRQVVGGEPILLQDAIRSGTRSGMQILLLDETVFTIGPESELVIDEFVYDPKTHAGKLGAEITKGVFRFVSGKIAHEKPEDMNVQLPAGTLGVRGTMVAGRVDPARKSSRLVLLGEGPLNDTGAPAGAFVACNAGACVRVNRPGFGTSIDGPDAPPVAPFRFPREELDALTGAVSDPEGWTQTAGAGAEATPPVSAAADEAGDEAGGDTRSATEVSGITTAASANEAAAVRAELRTLDGVVHASTEASQFSTQTVTIGGREVELPTSCDDAASCFADVFQPGTFFPENITTIDQLATLAASGLQQATYQQSGLPLINTNGLADGSYDFSLQVSLGNRTADLSFSNISSGILGLGGASFGQATDFSSWPLGFELPVGFAAVSTLTGSPQCAGGCQAVGTAQLANGNGRIADSALQALVITTPPGQTGTVTGTVSATPYQPIPR
ncbi:MAG: hypothetical protein DCC71_11280 [Proteobacteria bacterium]|nr:MAG: hypothetical protein DCC71_11280 [Pseudomonadota bacterium]